MDQNLPNRLWVWSLMGLAGAIKIVRGFVLSELPMSKNRLAELKMVNEQLAELYEKQKERWGK